MEIRVKIGDNIGMIMKFVEPKNINCEKRK